jgi:hypothetical protein
MTTPKKKWRVPRNPLVVPCRQRKAGPHRKGAGAQRQQATHATRRELTQLH